MGVLPAVGQILEELQAEIGRVGVERGSHRPAAVRLVPHRISRGKLDRARIAESAHAAHGAEVVVERAVLLHQNDDVLDVGDGAGAVVGGDGQRALDAGPEGGGEAPRAEQLQEGAAISGGRHDSPPAERGENRTDPGPPTGETPSGDDR